MNKLLLLAILFQKTDIATIIVLIGVVVLILVAALVSTISDGQDEKGKDDWLKENSEKLKAINNFELNVLLPLQNQVPKCRKCQGDNYQIWDVINEILVIRCVSCNTKLNINNITDSPNSMPSFSNYIDFVGEVYQKTPNQKLRLHLIEKLGYNFGGLKANQPLIRAIDFYTISKEIGSSTNFDVNFIYYSDVNNFNEDEHYIESNISLDSVNNFFEVNGDIDTLIKNGFNENLEAEKVSFAIPAAINGTQRLINVFKNGVPNNIQDDSNNHNSNKEVLNKEKRSRRISQEVKDKVWNRDGGKCVDCGSNENLEFDHIIPHSKGGANTYRNIQLLCEPCNRSKSAKIG